MLGLPLKYSSCFLFWCQLSGKVCLCWIGPSITLELSEQQKNFWVIFYIWPWTTGEAINIHKRNDTTEWGCNFYNLLLECEISPAENLPQWGSRGSAPLQDEHRHKTTMPVAGTEHPHAALRPFGTDKHFSLSAITLFLFRKKILLQKQLPSLCWFSLH